MSSKLRKLFAMLGSPNNHERLAALNAIEKHLGAVGVDWHTIADYMTLPTKHEVRVNRQQYKSGDGLRMRPDFDTFFKDTFFKDNFTVQSDSRIFRKGFYTGD